jgi:uncharacterized protein (TIGR03546 family)
VIRSLAKLLAVLNSETAPVQVSLGICLGMTMGLTPLASPHNLLVALLALVLRANLSGVLVGWAVFSALAHALDPLFHRIGLALLMSPALVETWTALYASELAQLLRFNHSIVLGSVVACLLGFAPMMWGLGVLIRRYRGRWRARVRQIRAVEALRATRFWRAYRRVAGTVSLP